MILINNCNDDISYYHGILVLEILSMSYANFSLVIRACGIWAQRESRVRDIFNVGARVSSAALLGDGQSLANDRDPRARVARSTSFACFALGLLNRIYVYCFFLISLHAIAPNSPKLYDRWKSRDGNNRREAN